MNSSSLKTPERRWLGLVTGMLVFVALALNQTVQAADGMIQLSSPHSVNETLNRLEAALRVKGMRIFDRIDHAGGAAKVGMELRPTELLIFGNPKVGTPLMHCGITAAIDLPMKALAWEDAEGKVWLAYNDPLYLGERHGISDCPVLKKMQGALKMFTGQAVTP